MGSAYEMSITKFGPEYGLLTYHYKFHNFDSKTSVTVTAKHENDYVLTRKIDLDKISRNSTFMTKYHERTEWSNTWCAING